MKVTIQEYFDSRKDITGVKVKRITILHHENDRYTGTAALWWLDREVTLSLHFQLKGEKVDWALGPMPLENTRP